MTGIAGNTFPFFKWFDQTEYKVIVSLFVELITDVVFSVLSHRILPVPGIDRRCPDGHPCISPLTSANVGLR